MREVPTPSVYKTSTYPLLSVIALATEARVVDDDVGVPTTHLARVVDHLGGLGLGEVDGDGAGLEPILGAHLGRLGVELGLTETHENQVATRGGVDVDEAGAEATIGAGDQCNVLHGHSFSSIDCRARLRGFHCS